MKEPSIEEFLKQLGILAKAAACEKDCGCDKEGNEEEEDECEFAEALKKEYEDLLEWVFGGEENRFSKRQATKIWKKQHPELPIPRIFKTEENFSQEASTVLLVLDVLPLYLAEKKK